MEAAGPLRKIERHDRLVANIHDENAFKPWITNGTASPTESIVQLDEDYPQGAGFHVYRMAPGMTTTPHEHTCHEQFLVLEGDITDNDGFEYKPGDLVLLKRGTQHSSSTRNGCTLAVFIATPETSLEKSG